MDLSLRSLSLSPLHPQHIAGLPPLGLSPLPPGLAPFRTRPVIRCNGEGADGSVQDKPAAKGSPHGSWLQTDSKTDSYSGWSSSNASYSSGSGIAGWVKIGGAIFLAVGFALGARSLYMRREVAKEFAAPVAVREQVVSPSMQSDSSETLENPDESGVTPEPSENEQNDKFAGHEREQHADNTVSEMHQEDISTGQTSPLSEDVEESNEKEVSISVSSAAAPTSEENLGHRDGLSETSATDLTVSSPPSDDAILEESAAQNSVESPVDVNKISNVPDEQDAFPADSNGKDVSPEALTSTQEASPALLSPLVASSAINYDKKEPSSLSSQEKVSPEDGNREELHSDPDLSNGFNVDLTKKDNLQPEEVMKLHEPCMSDFSLHDTDGSVQSVTSDKDFSSSSKERGLEKKSVQRREWDESNADAEPFASALELERWHFASAGSPAPSTPSAALRTTVGRVVVPAPVDHMQEQALAALQALKVIEGNVEPGAICTRREYARWLIAASATLSRSPAHKVFPAMYIDNVSELAFDDVLPEDLDFPFIQGLAEAGLIYSKLLTDDAHKESRSGQMQEDNIDCDFAPDSALTRQDLITWKIALERQHPLPKGITAPVGKEVLRDISGFIDTDQIHDAACPALVADLSAGERSIMSLAFGYTRRFQPEKPVTIAQAAIALATGEAWESVSEELARIEAEFLAEAAVDAELALEMKAQQEVTAAFNELLEVEKQKQEAAAQLADTTRAELEKLKAEWEEERYTLMRERASLEAEKEFLSTLRHEVEEQNLALSTAKVEVSFEREQVGKLHTEAEEERIALNRVRTDLEIEKNALSLARIWAEDEARKALAHAKVLEQARKRWEDQGVPVQVDKELDEANIPGPSWYYREGFQAQNSPVKGLIRKGQEFSKVVIEAVVKFLQFIQFILVAIRDRAVGFIKQVGAKAHEVRADSTSVAARRVEGLRQRVTTSTAGVASGLRESTRKAVDEWKGGAEKFAQKFKMS